MVFLNTKFFRKIPCIIFSLPILLNHTYAASIEEDLNKICDKVKSCAMADFSEEGLSDEQQKMLEPMLNGMCDALKASFQPILQVPELHDKAQKCMLSMTDASCESFDNAEVSRECEIFQQEVSKL